MTQLYHDKPRSVGVENALKRTAQLVDIKWTPIKPFPRILRSEIPDSMYYYGFFPAWCPAHGLPYSSCRVVEKYIGWNISFETFFSALRNPNSVVYTKNLRNSPGRANTNSYYGMVCSMFVSYSLQMPYRVVCKDWADVPGVDPVDTTVLENLNLCDIVLDPRHHVAIITDILRDEEGRVHSIEVSESTNPQAIRTYFTPEEFRNYWLEDGYSIYRYNGLDNVTYNPDPFVHLDGDPDLPTPKINTAIMLDFGNKANYRIDDEPVEISVFETGWEAVEVTDPDGTRIEYPIPHGKQLTLHPKKPGIYSVCLKRDGDRSDSVTWCMVNIDLTFEKDSHHTNEPINCRFDIAEPNDTAIYMTLNTDDYYVQGGYVLTSEEVSSCVATIPPIEKPGKYRVIILAKNQFGIYSSKYTELVINP